MKRLPSTSFRGNIVSVFYSFWKPVAVSLFWLISISLALSTNRSVSTEPVELTEVCIASNEVSEGKTITKGNVTTLQLPAKNAPQNAIKDCQQEQLFTIPLKHTLSAGDILQQSSFIDPQSDQGKLFTQLTTSNLKLMYLNPADVHVFPNRIEKGRSVAFYSKTKEEKEASILLNSVEITDIVMSEDEDGNQSLSQFGILVTPQQALQFTKVLEQKGFVQMVITSEEVGTIASPSATPKGKR